MTTITQHRSRPDTEPSVSASFRVLTDAEAAELGTTCDQHDRRYQADPTPATELGPHERTKP